MTCLFPTSLCGVLVFDSVSRVLPRLPASSRLPPPPLHTHLSHTIFVNHLCQPSSFTHHLSHTISHTPLCQPPSFTHHFSTTVSHIPSFTHIFVNHHLSHTIFHTPFLHTHTPSHTIFCQPSSFTHHLSHTISHTPSLTHTHTSLSTTTGGALGLGLVADDAVPLCVAGVALGDI